MLALIVFYHTYLYNWLHLNKTKIFAWGYCWNTISLHHANMIRKISIDYCKCLIIFQRFYFWVLLFDFITNTSNEIDLIIRNKSNKGFFFRAVQQYHYIYFTSRCVDKMNHTCYSSFVQMHFQNIEIIHMGQIKKDLRRIRKEILPNLSHDSNWH